MKKIFVSAIAVTAILSSCEQTNVSNVKLTNGKDSLSYTIGVSIGESFSQGGLKDLNYDLLIRGMKDQVDSMPAIELADAEKYIQGEMMKMQEAKAEVDKKGGVDWLAENKNKPGVMTTASGLQYKIDKEGTGPKPAASDVVTVHYHGTLTDGTVFDSSVDRGEPATFPLNRVILGWTEGVQLMNQGSKYTFYVPQELAYGSQGQGKIKPYSTLIFEVELLGIEPAPADGAMPMPGK